MKKKKKEANRVKFSKCYEHEDNPPDIWFILIISSNQRFFAIVCNILIY